MAKAVATSMIRFTVKCSSATEMRGLIQTEDANEKEKRVEFGDDGVAQLRLPAGKYVFVWAVKMAPITRHRYSLTVERVPDGGEPEELRKRPTERTTTNGEDLGWDDFKV